MKDYIQLGIEKGLISFNEDRSRIIYVYQKKERNYNAPPIAKNLTNGLGCGSTEFFVMRPKDERLAIEYLHVILHMKCVRETAMLYFGGSAGQQRVPSSYLENFDLPLPPKEKQLEMAHHVYQMRQKAKTLQQEGKHLLRTAKQEVERKILSGE